MKILLLEDEYMLLTSIKSFLLQKNHSVDTYESGKEALEAFLFDKSRYEMFILDINTPEMSGLELLQKIREHTKDTPIIMITANIDINSIDKAYSFGCNEYLKKPFNLRELEIRMERFAKQKPQESSKIIQITNEYTFDFDTDNLLKNGESVKLTKRQNTLLKLLISNSGRIIDFERIKNYVWADEYVEDSTVRSLINRLRNAIDEDFIQGYRGIGYMVKVSPK